MLYMVTARFKPGVEAQHAALAGEFGDHMRQPLLSIRLVGALADEAGNREGVLLMMETEDRSQLDHFLEISPYSQAGLYRSVDVDVLNIEALQTQQQLAAVSLNTIYVYGGDPPPLAVFQASTLLSTMATLRSVSEPPDTTTVGELVSVSNVTSSSTTLPSVTSSAGEWPTTVAVTSLAVPVAVVPLGGAENVTFGAAV